MTTTLQTVRLTATPAVIRAYGELTDDFNPIHIDPVFAAGTAMGGCIAHGTMSICLLWQALFRSFGGTTAPQLVLDVAFIKPVRVGETIEAGGTQRAGEDTLFDVWVRGEDGADRVVGTVRTLPSWEARP